MPKSVRAKQAEQKQSTEIEEGCTVRVTTLYRVRRIVNEKNIKFACVEDARRDRVLTFRMDEVERVEVKDAS